MAVLICVQTKANLCREMWRCLFLFLLVAFQIGSCAENSTEETCQSCQLADLTAKHKIYNWLVLSIVLLLLVLLLVVVGFLCYRMWPRDRSACERTVFRYNLAQDQQRVIISDISSSRTSPGEQDIQRIKAALACDTRLKSTKDTGVRQCVVQVSQENRRRKRAMKPSLRWKILFVNAFYYFNVSIDQNTFAIKSVIFVPQCHGAYNGNGCFNYQPLCLQINKQLREAFPFGVTKV